MSEPGQQIRALSVNLMTRELRVSHRCCRVGLIAWLLIADPFAEAATAGLLDDLSQNWKIPIGSDPKRQPPMDNPPVEWFQYRKDALGRDTFLSEKCLNERDRTAFSDCLSGEINGHKWYVQWRGLEIQKEASEKAERDARDAQLALEEERLQMKLEKQALADRDEAERRRKLAYKTEEANAYFIQKRAAAMAQKAASNPNTYAVRIRNDQKTIQYYQSSIASQKRAALISGYENMQVLYQAGIVIDASRQDIARQYASYRKLGGKQSLEQIMAGR